MQMNRSQRMIVAAATFVAVLMFFFPPYQMGSEFSLNARALGYAFIGNPPFLGKINFAMLLAQWGMVAVLAAVLVWVNKGSK